MGDETVLLVVLSNAVAGREDEYNEWYDDHVHQLVDHVDQIRSANRYRLADASQITGGELYSYLCIYELDGDIDTARAAMSTMQAERADAERKGRSHPAPLSDAMDFNRTVSWWFVPAGDSSRRGHGDRQATKPRDRVTTQKKGLTHDRTIRLQNSGDHSGQSAGDRL